MGSCNPSALETEAQGPGKFECSLVCEVSPSVAEWGLAQKANKQTTITNYKWQS